MSQFSEMLRNRQRDCDYGARRGLWRSAPLMLALTGCVSAPLDRSDALVSYDGLTPSDGVLTRSLLRVSTDEVLAAKTVQIAPTRFSGAAARIALSDQQRRLIANNIDRSLCNGLSARFRVVPLGEPSDLTVQAHVTHVALTNEVAAGVSKVASFVPSFLSLGVPVPVPRIPLGLGGLSIDAEARDASNGQKAAMVWARMADSFTSSPKISTAADAYDLAAAFGGDFSQMLVTGESPFGRLPPPPSVDSIGTALGMASKHARCAAFGRNPGVVGMLASRIGLAPEWTDPGATAP
jgi:hypothetical protein